MSAAPATAVVLAAHGTVESLDDLPAFLANIRRGHPAPPELVAEVRRRYAAIGGRSPLLDVSRSCARKLEARLGVPVRIAMRLWHPYPTEVLAELAAAGIRRVVVVPLAQHSARVYGEAVERTAAELAATGGTPRIDVVAAENWGRAPELVDAFAAKLRAAIAEVPEAARGRTTVIMSAHSLPVAVVRAGDPYETEVRAAADLVARAAAPIPRVVVAFQSQGMSAGPGGAPMQWLGPDLVATMDEAKSRGDTHVVVAPIGFLADHVEILYDLDIEARAQAKDRGLVLTRTRSLGDDDALIDALAAVARPLLASSASASARGGA